MEKISVLIPTYNVELYIEEALQSILNQTHSNLEIIIVDDSSTDNTFKILEEFSRKDGRIKLYRNKSNMKICYTLNFAFKCSTGEYIARMDGDDISEYDRFEKQLNFLKSNQHIDLVGLSVVSINQEGKELSRIRYIESAYLLKKASQIVSPVSHIWMARRSVYEKLGGYRELPSVEDYDFLLRMLTSDLKFSNLSGYYGYKVRNRDGNTASTAGIKQRKAFDYVKDLYQQRVQGNNIDSFTEMEFSESINVSKSEMENYNKSLKFLKKGIKLKSDNNIFWTLYILLAALRSKYQLKYLFRSFLMRVLIKIDKVISRK